MAYIWRIYQRLAYIYEVWCTYDVYRRIGKGLDVIVIVGVSVTNEYSRYFFEKCDVVRSAIKKKIKH